MLPGVFQQGFAADGGTTFKGGFGESIVTALSGFFGSSGSNGGPGKMAITARLRKETTLKVKRIAARLHLGTSKSASIRPHGWMCNQVVATKPPEAQRLNNEAQTL
jgi:hypothetical protein